MRRESSQVESIRKRKTTEKNKRICQHVLVSYLVVVALLVNSLDNATEVPSIHLPHEGGDVAMIEVAREQNSLELIGLDKLPGPAMGKPDDDALGIRVGKHLMELHGEGGFLARRYTFVAKLAWWRVKKAGETANVSKNDSGTNY